MKRNKRTKSAVAIIILAAILATAVYFYQKINAPKVQLPEDGFLYVPTGTNYEELVAVLEDQKFISDKASFEWIAKQKNLPNNVRPGRYEVKRNMSIKSLVSMLRNGEQKPLNVVINKFRLKEELAGFISQKLEIDSLALLIGLNDEVYLRTYGITPETSMSLFVPNTYEFYWNTSLDRFMERMKLEFDNFWNDKRRQEANKFHLTPEQVMILASIVEEETNYEPEKSTIAGVYMNRLQKGILLQADPTVKFALKDFTITRVLTVHTEYDSPYNTYRYSGLPPGPICTPSIKTIDAVLNAETHNYLYFCASPDKIGTHAFAKTLREHELNAKRYQKWLNQQR